MKKGTSNHCTTTSNLYSTQKFFAAINDSPVRLKTYNPVPFWMLCCKGIILHFQFFVVCLPWGLPVAHAFYLRCKQSCFARKPAKWRVVYQQKFRSLPKSVRSSVPSHPGIAFVEGQLSEGNLNFRHRDPNTWKVVKIKNIYLCLSISARVPFGYSLGYWIHEPIAGQNLALISLAGFCWPRLPKHGNGSFVVIERKQNPLSSRHSCCRHSKIFKLGDTHMNCT